MLSEFTLIRNLKFIFKYCGFKNVVLFIYKLQHGRINELGFYVLLMLLVTDNNSCIRQSPSILWSLQAMQVHSMSAVATLIVVHSY